MTTTAPIPEPAPVTPPPDDPGPEAYALVRSGHSFARLRTAHRRFAAAATAAFAAWYIGYVLLCVYAPGVAGVAIAGRVNVALAFGLAQFASTFAIAWAYSRRAVRVYDPLAAALRDEVEAARAAAGVRAAAVPAGEGA